MLDEMPMPHLTDDEAHARVEETGEALDYIDAQTGQICHIDPGASDDDGFGGTPGTGSTDGDA